MKRDSSWLRGPWAWTYDGSSDYSIGRANDPQGYPVAHVHSRGPEIGSRLCNLISAAPELLATLKGMACKYCEFAHSDPGGASCDACASVRQLIAKTEADGNMPSFSIHTTH